MGFLWGFFGVNWKTSASGATLGFLGVKSPGQIPRRLEASTPASTRTSFPARKVPTDSSCSFSRVRYTPPRERDWWGLGKTTNETNQPINQSIKSNQTKPNQNQIKSLNQSIQSIHQPINQSNNQTIKQTNNQTTNQANKQTIKQTTALAASHRK